MKTYPIMCRIRAQGTTTRLDIFDDIGDGGFFSEGVTAKDVAAKLSGATGPLDVHINSYGGSVADGIAITNAIRDHQGPTRTIVDGMACSAASVIMQAGAERIVQPGAMVMIHDASSSVMGNAADMAKAAEELDKHSDNIAGIYARRAGGTPGQWRDAMKAETWYTADEAVEAGLADKVGTGAAAIPASMDLSQFTGSIPDRIYARLQTMPRREVLAAYQPQPYHREAWENVCCPVCGCYNDDDGKYCGQCGIMLAGRDDVTSERAPGGAADRAPGQPAAGPATEWLRQQAAAHRATATSAAARDERETCVEGAVDIDISAMLADLLRAGKIRVADAAEIDESDWDGPKAMSMAAKSDDPAATFKQICAGRREGDASKEESWALPYRYPGKGPNAAGVRNALSRLPQTEGLTNEAEARALLQRLMKQVNPDYDGDGAGNRAPSWATDETAAMPAWLTQTNPAVPAWFNPA